MSTVKQQRSPSQHDGLAVTAFVTSWLIPVVGVVLGIVSVASSHRDGRKASGLAIAGIVTGALLTCAAVAVIAVLTSASAGGPAMPPPSCDPSSVLYPYC